MSKYVILIVSPIWQPGRSPGLSEYAATTWRNEVEVGARILIYKPDPINAVVAEAEYMGILENAAQWPVNNVREVLRTATGARPDYLLPLKVLYVHDQIHHIPLSSVQAIAPDFSPQQGEWYPLNLEAYRDLVHWPV